MLLPFFNVLDQLLHAASVGITVWHFFVFSPRMFGFLGRRKFVPQMMLLTRAWATTTLLLQATASVASFLVSASLFSSRVSLAALVLQAINSLFVVPLALKRGHASMQEREKTDSRDFKDFAVEGGSSSSTKPLHLTVVAFVLAATVANIAHLCMR